MAISAANSDPAPLSLRENRKESTPDRANKDVRLMLARLPVLIIFALNFLILPINCSRAGTDLIKYILPSWPITNVGDPIPANLLNDWTRMGDSCPALSGQYDSFPSKGNYKPRIPPLDPRNPGEICNDGDQTLYNGELCAAGVSSGCRAVAEAQGSSGRWYRSPHRRWFFANRCFDKAHPVDPATFSGQCANGFSPDMNLGVLLYVLKTGNSGSYRHWLDWLNGNATTTKLCDKNGSKYDNCVAADWPRVCTDDLGYADDATPILGKYGGQCALRPTDANDFIVVDQATGSAPPPNMSHFEVVSLQLEQGFIPPGTSPLLFMAMTDGTNFPLHLDAVRVLMRMMVQNPSLELNNLPNIPDPVDALASVLDNGTLENPVELNAIADIIASRARWNPFFQLLADGPTPAVRNLIISSCPVADSHPQKTDWLWEKSDQRRSGSNDDGLLDNDPQRSMGWDCVFVGSLYNKMRVRKDLSKELVALLLQYLDPLDKELNQLSMAFQQAETANELALKAFNQAAQTLSDTEQFVNVTYAQLNEQALQTEKSLRGNLVQFLIQENNWKNQATQDAAQAAQMPDQVAENIENSVCDNVLSKLGDVVKQACHTVVTITNVPNAAKDSLIKSAANLNSQILNLENTSIRSTNDQISQCEKEIADLNAKYLMLSDQLNKGALQSVVIVARANLELQSELLYNARQAIAKVQETHDKAEAYLTVWERSS